MNDPTYVPESVAELAEVRKGQHKLLVDLLKEAAKLEHCLLNAYLYAACSLKSTPGEFEKVDGHPNQRRAIQFERVRTWKQHLLEVTHEEMLHLHYVQCMLRALGESPCFDLPAEDEKKIWVIPGWKARIGEKPVEDGTGVRVPVEPMTPETIRHFVLYESTDSLQDADPFGPEAMALFKRLRDFELDYRLESCLYHVQDESERAKLAGKLRALWFELPPITPEAAAPLLTEALPAVEDIRFQSISDLYTRGILPLYEEAFAAGAVQYANRDLNDELLDPDYACQGLLPIGPVHRDKNFEARAKANVSNPLRHYRNIHSIIDEIVREGEGFPSFSRRAAAFLAKVDELGGARQWLQAEFDDANTPDWLADGQLVRKSHLYRFAVILAELDAERELAHKVGVTFAPSREPARVDHSPPLQKFASELPAWFNAAYLVLLAWLSRMYEIRNWVSDTSRRRAIEMLASWPLMSMAIRPFLELASCLPIDPNQLFRLRADKLPQLPTHASQLLALFQEPRRSQERNERMDYLAVRVLSDVARWAASQRDVLDQSSLPPDLAQLISTRLKALTVLDEFQKQFPFRVAGGYSSRPPNRAFQQDSEGADRYEEDPAAPDEEDPTAPAALFEQTLALRVRFSGHGLIQLATDSDPTDDESGCTGTHMLHASDGDRRFDRSVIWQPNDPTHDIVRAPREGLPNLGVNGVEVALLVAPGVARASYLPLQVLQSTGAVQTNGVQCEMRVYGFQELLSLPVSEILGDSRRLRLSLQPRGGMRPFLNGLNHLVWQDGEPIDPFVLAILADDPDGATRSELFTRTVFDEGRALLEMEPYERLLTRRAPVGFDSYKNTPAWALNGLSEADRKRLKAPDYPQSYLRGRAQVLLEQLRKSIDCHPDQQSVDQAISYAERMRRVSVPRRTTVTWLKFLLHYGHTVSGPLNVAASNDPLLGALHARTNLRLRVHPGGGDRKARNSRWLMKYTLGVMDTDAITNLVFGELYIPLTVEVPEGPVKSERAWSFPAEIFEAVRAYACRFAAPFWAHFDVDGDTRRTKLPSGVSIVERIVSQDQDGYSYTASGLPDVSDYSGEMRVSVQDGRAKLTWSVSFQPANPTAAVQVLGVVAGAASAMTEDLRDYLTPK